MALLELPPVAALGPALALLTGAFAIFLYNSVYPRSSRGGVIAAIGTTAGLTSLGLAVWFALAGLGTPSVDGGLGVVDLAGDQLVVDQLAIFFMLVVAIVTTLVCLASADTITDLPHQAEYYSLVLLAATGMALMAAANSLVTVFVAIELTSLPSYALVGILKDNRGSVEAAMKYFLIGALSSAIFVYGISLVYGATGVLQLEAIARELSAVGDAGGLLGLGMLFLLGGLAFKMASVPFHFWAPEAYEGAPAPIAAFLSSASKAAGFVVAFRVFTTAFPLEQTTPVIGIDWTLLFVVLAIITMTVGNFAAAIQPTVKRMLAYSSVGHAGYALIGLAGLTGIGDDSLVLGAAMMHLLVYGFMNTGAFLFIALAEYWGIGRRFEDFNGLARQAPIACVAMTVFLFSLAGLPPLGGFFSKFFLFTGAIGAGLFVVAGALLVNSALSLYYYSRLLRAIWFEPPVDDRDTLSHPTGIYVALLVAAVMTVVVLPGFGPVADAASQAAAGLVG